MSRTAQPLVRTLVLTVSGIVLTACGSTGSHGNAAPAPSATTKPSPAPVAAEKKVAAGKVAAEEIVSEKTAPAKKRVDAAPVAVKRPSSAKKVTSDVSQLKALGIDLDEGVLIDVADDGLKRYLAVGAGGVVDFTGTSRTDNSMMSLRAASVARKSIKNRVAIVPPFYNEDLGAGQCVADTAPGKLKLATCDAAKANQIWEVVPAGDSGQFELHGAYTDIRVNQGRITVGATGYVGLQTIPFAE